jgi:ATP-binding cassette subfamily B protein
MNSPSTTEELNRSIISNYTDQPRELPPEIRQEVHRLWEGQEVQLYALADLDDLFTLNRAWVVLGEEHLAVVRADTSGNRQIQNIERKNITAVRDTPGLSCTELRVLGEPDKPALAVLRYTRRQQRAMENIRFVLEEALKGQEVETSQPDDVYADSVASPIREAQASVSHQKMGVIWRLVSYLKPYRRVVSLGVAGAILLTLADLVQPQILRYLIDNIIMPYGDGQLSSEKAMSMGWIMIGILAAVFLLREFFRWIRLRTLSLIGENVAHDLRRELFDHLQTLSLNFFSKKQTGSIISRVSSDTDRLWDFIAFGIVEVLLAVIMLFGLGTVLIVMDWRLGLLMTLPIPIFLGGYYWMGHEMQKLFLSAWRHWSNLTAVLGDNIPGMRVVKAFSQEETEKSRFAARNDQTLKSFHAVHHTWTTAWPFIMVGFQTIILLLWTFAMPRLFGVTEPALEVGDFVALLFYAQMFLMPLEIIGQMTRMMNRAVSSAHRIFEILDTEPQITNIKEPVRLEPLKGDLEFENVSFSYDGVRRVLKNVSFQIKPGEMVGLVGPSGSGKTTIINLLARFYEANDGNIRVDGHEIQNLEIDTYRKQLGMVLQDAFLFHGTIIENIRYGLPEASYLDVVNAARAANAHDFINKLPQGYETIVGERGHTLSGGERQRVSIARAILHNPRILILDEATSNVDTETERKIQEALDRLVSGRTTLAIAHRLSTLQRADRLLVMKEGRLVEEGTHSELLALDDGIYKNLHNLQVELASRVGV